MERIYANENLRENLKLLESMGYKYIVKAKDKMLSGWGISGPTGHIQLIAAKNLAEVEAIMADLQTDNSFSCIDYQAINNYAAIKRYTKGKSFSIRNDWTRYLTNIKCKGCKYAKHCN